MVARRRRGIVTGGVALVMMLAATHPTHAQDTLPLVTITATDANASEVDLDAGVFTFSRTGDTSGSLTVTFTVAGDAEDGIDYASIGDSVVFDAGAQTATLMITPLCDGNPDEGTEIVTLTLTADQNSPSYAIGDESSATVSIVDDTRPLVTITATDPDASEIGPDPGMFTFSRDGDLSDSLTVSFTVGGTANNGEDYEPIVAPYEVTFDAGAADVTLVITPLCDGDPDEGIEQVTLTLQPEDGYRLPCEQGSQATVSITDDARPLVTITATDPDASEIGPDPGMFTFRRDGDLSDPLTVSFTVGGTANNGTDYESIVAPYEVTFAGATDTSAGAADVTLLITPIDDSNNTEGTEQVTLTLQPEDGYRLPCEEGSQATVSIQDDNIPPLCDTPTDTTCKNQWMVDLYQNTCEGLVDACNWTIDTAAGLCHDACKLTQAGLEYYCNARQLICDTGQNACEVYNNDAYNVCINTGLGSGCNAQDAGCRLGCAGQCTRQCWKPCLVPWRQACKDCVGSCSSNCNSACTTAYNSCKTRECANLQATCKGCDDCKAALQLECDNCEAIANAECTANCEDTADALCIEEKQLGETCNYLECASGLRCLPDLTSFEGLGPGALVEAILESTSVDDVRDNIINAAKDSGLVGENGGLNLDLSQYVCLNNNCTCQKPLLQSVGTELDAKACMALYRPGRHLQAWLVNDVLKRTDDFRKALSDAFKNMGMPDELVDNLASRYQKLAFVYGVGGAAADVAGGSVEVGTVYGPDCYGCYFTVCGGATSDVSASAYGTLGVYDASYPNPEEDPAINNLQGWSRFVQLGGSTPGVEIGGSTSFFVAPGEVLGNIPAPNKFLSGDAWTDAIASFQSDFQGWKDAAQSAHNDDGKALFDAWMNVLLNELIPTGRTGAVSVGVGGDPVTAGGGVCYTWVTPSICLNKDRSDPDNTCIAGDFRGIDLQQDVPNEPDLTDPPTARCSNQTVAARGPTDDHACTADANIDWGSWDPAGQDLTITQDPPGPFDIGTHDVTLTVADSSDATRATATCAATVTVEDRSPPDIVTEASDSTVECDGAGNTSAVNAWVIGRGGASASDCSSMSWSDNFVGLTDGCGATGSAEVMFTATDAHSKQSTTSATFTIVDSTAPTITCPTTTYKESPPGSCTDDVSYSVTASDECGTTTITCVPNNAGASGVTATGGTFPVGTTTVACTATDECGLTSECSFDVVVNDPPQIVSVSPSTQPVQYSDKIVPVVVTATDCGPGDHLTLEFDPADVPNGLALSSAADACGTNGAGLVECTWTLRNNDRVLEPEGTYAIDAIKAVDPTPLNGVTLKSSPDESIKIDVKAENATIAFDDGNPVAVQVAVDGGNSGVFDLTVHVQELYPESATAGGELPGDIGLAVAVMTLTPVGPGTPATGTCTPDNDPTPLDYTGELTVTCEFDDVPVNTYTVEAVLVANGAGELYYTGSNDDVVVVFDPSLGFTTGGGWFFWPGTSDRTNFGYTMKYNRKRTHIQGNLLLIRHMPDGTIYRVKSNALYGLALGGDSDLGWASFAGKATYQDPSMIEPEGNHEFVTYVEDLGEPGTGNDRFWVQVFDKDGTLIGDLSMAETAVANAETIDGGNIVVPHTTKSEKVEYTRLPLGVRDTASR